MATPPVQMPGISDLPNWLRDKTEHEAIKHFVATEASKIGEPITYHDFLVMAADTLFDVQMNGPSFTKLRHWVLAGLTKSPANYELRLRLLVSLLMRLQTHAYFPGRVVATVADIVIETRIIPEGEAHELTLPLSRCVDLMDQGDGSQSVEAWLARELKRS